MMENISLIATALVSEQCLEWEVAGDNFAALRDIEIKEMKISGFDFRVQFNPKRIQSSAAKVDKTSIKNRNCFLCIENRPSIQRGIPFTSPNGTDYTILVNPFPIFKQHLTIPTVAHTDQRIADKIADMLSLSTSLSDFLLFYNGPRCGASAPDHFHFQAGNKGSLPIEINIDKIIEHHSKQIDRELFTLPDYPVRTFIYRSASPQNIINWFDKFYAKFESITPDETEPMMNLLSWHTDDYYYLVVFPRRAHRPTQFFAEGDANILTSPGAIELGGIFITPLEKDFTKITCPDIVDIMKQISVTPQIFDQLCK